MIDLNTISPIQLLPHRPPFLFVDQVESLSFNTDLPSSDPQIVTSYTHSSESATMKAHFPGHPIIPGVLLLEGLFQSAALWILLKAQQEKELLQRSQHLPITRLTTLTPMVTRIDQVKFKSPGQADLPLHYEITLLQLLGEQIQQYKGVVKQHTSKTTSQPKPAILGQCEFVVGLF